MLSEGCIKAMFIGNILRKGQFPTIGIRGTLLNVNFATWLASWATPLGQEFMKKWLGRLTMPLLLLDLLLAPNPSMSQTKRNCVDFHEATKKHAKLLDLIAQVSKAMEKKFPPEY